MIMSLYKIHYALKAVITMIKQFNQIDDKNINQLGI